MGGAQAAQAAWGGGMGRVRRGCHQPAGESYLQPLMTKQRTKQLKIIRTCNQRLRGAENANIVWILLYKSIISS